MLPKRNRLNIRRYFTEIRGNGKKLSSQNYAIYFRLNPEQKESQFNTVISKKVSKSAVKRNRMRRLIHTALSTLKPDINPQMQGMFFMYKDFSTQTSIQVTEEIKELLKKANLLK
jgi:ribonuclease P protein component